MSSAASTPTPPPPFKAVLFDFGGVILSSPFEAFNHFERDHGLPLDFIRTVNATNPDTNAWARFERNELSFTEFDEAFAADSKALGHEVRGADVLGRLQGEPRPSMVDLLDRVKAAGYLIACLTNNITSTGSSSPYAAEIGDIMLRFDAVVESSKTGVRKPEPRFYEMACELLGVHPNECVFLDDLGINLKPAAAMGMTTIKVLGADQAIADLETVLGWR